MMVRFWCAVLLLGIGPAHLAAQPTDRSAPDSVRSTPPLVLGKPLGWNDLLRAREALDFAAGEARLSLAHPFVQFGSEVAQAGDSLLVRNQDYGIDYVRGVFFLLARPTAPVHVSVTYLYLPGPTQRSFRAADLATREAALAGTTAGLPAARAPASSAATEPVPALPPNLQLSGSKSIGVSFGRNREATLDQSLRVEAAGELGEGLRVNAVLADDNLPVTASGSTEELGDLSKVFIEMQGPVVGGVIGDFSLQRRQGELVDVQRDLRGGEVRLHHGEQSLAVGAGLAKGQYVSTSFRGSEGRQGPYDLLSARRVDFSTIVPGSERVYLDGVPMRRGENQDYVLDYERGELRFTSRRRISADSEIGVDYQVGGAGYRRSARDARWDTGFHGIQVRGLLFQEGDDPDKPLTGDYDAEDIAALAAAGDGRAIAPGIRVVGVGKGLYRYDAFDSTIVHYDPLRGDLEVDFYEAGPQGAYDDSLDALSGRRIYVYRGPGRAAFAIGRLLAPATLQRLASARLEAAPWNGAARLAGDVSVSSFDANRFSGHGDADNTGEALDVLFDAGPHAADRGPGGGVRLHWSQLSARFHAPGRSRPPFYYKDWNAESDSLHDTERLAEMTLGYGFGGATPWLRADANLGRLDRRGDLRTDRGQLEVGLGRSADRGIDVVLQALDTERPALGSDAGRQRDFVRGAGRWRIGKLLPAVRIEHDTFVRADIDSVARPSYRYLEVASRLGLLETHRTSAGVEFVRRDTDERRPAAERDAGLGEWSPSRRNDTVAFDLLARPVPSVATELGLSRRTNDPLGASGGAESRSDLARAVLGWTPVQHAARAEWRYELSGENVRTLQQVLVLAPDGKGDYDAEGHPVGRDLGLYDKVTRYTGATEPVRQLESSLHFELGGGFASGIAPDSSAGWLRRNVSFQQLLSAQEQTRREHGTEQLIPNPSAFDDSATVFGNFKARQEWSFLNGSARDALKLFLDWQSGFDGRLAGAPIRQRDRAATLRYERTGVRRWTYGGEAGMGHRDRNGQLDAAIIGRLATGTYDVRSGRVAARCAYRMSASENVGLQLEATQQRDGPSTTRQQLLTASPSATLAPWRNLRLLSSAAVTRVFEDKPDDVLAPYWFDPPGTKTTVSFLGSYRLGQYLNFNLNYSGVRGTDGRFFYDVKAETRAIF
jgi:hypothetical protein